MTADQAEATNSTAADQTSEALAAMTAERDYLICLLDERDRTYVPILAERTRAKVEIQRLNTLLDERNRELAGLRGECGTTTAEAERLRADLKTCQETIARAEEEIAWLRELTNRLTRLDRDRYGGQ